jgi:hypothetical protein
MPGPRQVPHVQAIISRRVFAAKGVEGAVCVVRSSAISVHSCSVGGFAFAVESRAGRARGGEAVMIGR